MKHLLSIYATRNRNPILMLAAALIAIIAWADWLTDPFVSLGFLYLFPIIAVGGFLTRAQLIGVAMLCAALSEYFSNLPWSSDSLVRLAMSCVGFGGTGLFISELVRNRRVASRHIEEIEEQARLRRDAEEQLRALAESSPAAIVTMDESGTILLANEAAQQMLAPGGPVVRGQRMGTYLPSLEAAAQAQPTRVFRTTLQCTGKRANGQLFLAGAWFSTCATGGGARVAAIIVDLSEEVRGREDLSLDHLLTHARIVMSGVAHEIRNLCSAAVVVHKNLSRVEALAGNADFAALGTLIQGLEQLAELELRPSASGNGTATDLKSVLEEVRVLIDATLQESAIESQWLTPARLPAVWADRYGLLQVFLNLIRNSQRAMLDTPAKQLQVVACEDGGRVVVRVADSGVGIEKPDDLFRPFRRGAAGATGLGLYVSRAILRSFGADLVYEPREAGSCFAVVLRSLRAPEERSNA